MPPNIVSTAMMLCSFGMAPSTLTVLPTAKVMIEGMPAGSIMDSAPMVNIAPFGMCMSLANPTVASATAAALGVLTPMPCVPVTTPWAPGAAKTMIGGKPALTVGSMCNCTWAGIIQVTFAGSVKTMSS
jgi:uncharacterized Zn-binding protein involved in type VI secretion